MHTILKYSVLNLSVLFSVVETHLVLTLESWVNLIDMQWFPVYLLPGSVITCCEDNNLKKNVWDKSRTKCSASWGRMLVSRFLQLMILIPSQNKEIWVQIYHQVLFVLCAYSTLIWNTAAPKHLFGSTEQLLWNSVLEDPLKGPFLSPILLYIWEMNQMFMRSDSGLLIQTKRSFLSHSLVLCTQTVQTHQMKK